MAYVLQVSTLWRGVVRCVQPFGPREAVASNRRGMKSSELSKAAHSSGNCSPDQFLILLITCEVLQPNLHLGTCLSDAANAHTAHIVTLRPQHIFDSRMNAGFRASQATFVRRQRTFGADDQGWPSRYPTPSDHWRNVAAGLAWTAHNCGR